MIDPVQVKWAGAAGGVARVLSADEVQVTVRSSRPFPPGAPAQGALEVAGGVKVDFTLKVATSRKVEEGVWDVRGRLVSATREVRSAFQAALPSEE